MKSNCLWYALDQWVSVGGSLGLVHSMHWCIPHVQHTDLHGVLTHFVPPHKLKYPWMSLSGFRGVVEIGDKDAARRGPMHPLCIGLGLVLFGASGSIWLVTRSVQSLFGRRGGLPGGSRL